MKNWYFYMGIKMFKLQYPVICDMSFYKGIKMYIVQYPITCVF